MDSIWILIIVELIVLTVILIIKLLFKYIDNKKINNIVDFLEKKSIDKSIMNRIDECQSILNTGSIDNKGENNNYGTGN